MADTNFVHLHCHTEYSLLDGLSKIKKLVARVKELEMSSIAMTDHGVMYGAIEFYKQCVKEGVKPLIGMEAYTVVGDHTQKSGKGENNHLILLAKDYEGYKNLMKLSTIAHTEGFYYKPRFSRDMLRKYSKGLICTSSCPKGEIAQAITSGNYAKAKDIASWFSEVFGEGNYYLEIQRHFYKNYFTAVADKPKILDNLNTIQRNEDLWVKDVIRLSRDLGIPLVATNDAHYIKPSDATAQDALVCISTGKNVSDVDRIRYIDTPTFYLTTPDEMATTFSDIPESLTNTVKVADACDVQIELGKWYFPKFEIPDDKQPEVYLRELVEERLALRYAKVDDALKQRINFELDTIIGKGYAPYFLMLSDLVNWCESNGIITNTRGSAAGSVVSYIMGITTVDPIHFLLPFERFLNPFRPSPPDIDLDIADDRREELIAHVVEKYGKDKVAQICTFGRMLARAAVRDVARVLGHPYAFGDRLAKVIPMGSQGFPMSIDRALTESTEFKAMYDTDPLVKETVDLAKIIEGNARHSSVHAAGTVVSPHDMTDYTPLQLEPKGTKIITQYEMHACEDVGLVKFDILGIRNLSILGAARDIIEQRHNIKINLRTIPTTDKKTFAMLARGDTMGVFQMGGSGMTKWLKELKPTRIEDLMIMIAIFRPGPMANIPEFIMRKNGKAKVSYMHPKMEKYLDKSFGILVYQDDVLFTALELAGYDWNSVDKFRKAIGKKIPEEMAKQHEIFVEGCQKTSNMTKEEAEKLWDLFVPFQGYGFNKAHAASYGIVSYQTAYLKANYPVEYMTALLTAESGYTEKIVEAVDECKRLKIKVLGPDINKSDIGFSIEQEASSLEGQAIRFGFSAVKNVGEVAIKIILESRKQEGEFKSFTDFCMKVDLQKVNRKVLESLIKAGAMDSFGNRASMLASIDKIRESGISVRKIKDLGQFSLFGDESSESHAHDSLVQLAEFEKEQKLEMEKELLGFYLTEHPKEKALGTLKTKTSHSLAELAMPEMHGQKVIAGGIIESMRVVVTKNNNQQMCFAKVTDLTKSVEIVVFPKVYALNPGMWKQDMVIIFAGKVELRESNQVDEETGEAIKEATVLIESAHQYTGDETPVPTFNQYQGNSASATQPKIETVVRITVPKGLPSEKLVQLNTLLQNSKGTRKAELEFLQHGTAKVFPLPYTIDWSPESQKAVHSLLNGV